MSTPPGGLTRFLAIPHTTIDVLAYNNGVIHHNSEDENESEQGDHVDGDTHLRHQPNSSCKRNWNTKCYQQGETWSEKKSEDQEHEQKTPHPVALKQGKATLKKNTGIVPDLEVNSLGDLCSCLF